MWTRDSAMDNSANAIFLPNHVVPLVLSTQCSVLAGLPKNSSKRQSNLMKLFGTPTTKKSKLDHVEVNSKAPTLEDKPAKEHEPEVELPNPEVMTEEVTPLIQDTPERNTSSLVTDMNDSIHMPSNTITKSNKMWLINHREPETCYKFPPKQYKDSSEKEVVKQRYCSIDWFKT